MSLKLIYGRAGSGKSEYCFKDIVNRLNKEKKIYIIVPEQFSFTAEKKLLDSIKEKSVISAEVLTFNRMAYRVMNEIGFGKKVNLSKCGKSMLIHNILVAEKRKLKLLNKSNQNVDIIDRLITELKKHNIKLEDLKKISNDESDIYLKTKLEDISLMYEEFENKIQNNYIDENDVLSILASKLEETKLFNDTVIYIDEFVGFTPQEYSVIRSLLKVAKQVNITLATDNKIMLKEMQTDVFYPNKITLNNIIKLAKEENIQIDEVVLNNSYRFKSEELLHLEQNIYSVRYEKYDKNVENISLFLAQNYYSEVEQIAKEISRLVKKQNYRYKDIGIITKNTEQYSNIFKAVFPKYNIPIFIDEKKLLSQNILIKFVLSLIDILAKNWSYDAVFSYLKTGMLEISSNDIYALENYVIKWGIKGKKWLDIWNYEEDEEKNSRLNNLREFIVNPIRILKDNLKHSRTIKDINKEIYLFLINNNINKILEKKAEELKESGNIEISNEYISSWNIFIEVLDEMVLVLHNEKITFEKYAELLKVGITNRKLGEIPSFQDSVIIGDIERSRSHKVKAIFIIGLNDGVFPSINKNEGFLDDKDRDYLKEKGIQIAKTTMYKLYDDEFNIYKAFTTAEEKLFLSYAASDNEGKSLRASILINKIKKIFPKIEEKSDIISKEYSLSTLEKTFDDLLINLSKLKQGVELDKLWFNIFKVYDEDKIWSDKLKNLLHYLQNDENMNDINISKENIEKLYQDDLRTSISKLESYRACPFSYFLKYGLKLSDKNLFKIESLDTGSFMHNVIDEFFTKINEKSIPIGEIDEKDIKSIIEEIVVEKLKMKRNYIFTASEKYKVLVSRLKRLLIKSIKYILYSIKVSDFEILGNEVEFKENKEYPPIKISLDDGKTIEVIGKIDRVDIAKNSSGNYIRIIDYKSSVKNIDLNEVVAGINLQLITYLDAITKIENVIPAGVLYFSLLDPMLKLAKDASEEEIEDKIKKEFKMNGLILAEVNVVKMMDKNLVKGASNIVPAYIDKEGNVSLAKPGAVTKEDFENLQNQVNKTIKQIAKEMLSGNINIKPYYSMKNKKTPCEYCKYKSICNFDQNDCKGQYNYIPNYDKNVVLDSIKNSPLPKI